eukprot:15331274-Ditylum_brightwellii.AAC.2
MKISSPLNSLKVEFFPHHCTLPQNNNIPPKIFSCLNIHSSHYQLQDSPIHSIYCQISYGTRSQCFHAVLHWNTASVSISPSCFNSVPSLSYKPH